MKKFLPETIVLCAILMVVRYGFAQTWTQTSAQAQIDGSEIACSADGKVILVVNSTSKPRISIDSGDTWITNTSFPTFAYSCAAAAADGTKLVIPANYIYVSSDSGNTWIQTTAPVSDWRAVASSANGIKLFGGVYGGLIWISTNSGSTWQVSSAPSKQWRSLASSADGTKLIGSGTGQIYTSTNSGASWQLSTVSGVSVAMSADGNTLVVTGSGSTYISTNSGSSWMTNAINGGSVSGATGDAVALSADGKRQVVAGFDSQIYTSIDSGITWVTNDAPSSCLGVASSADGCRLVALSDDFTRGIGIWIGQVIPSPQLNLAPVSNNIVLSWLVPSTNFVLQQNLDLTTTNWVTLSNTPTLNLTNLNNEITISPSNSSGFFRLMAQ